MKNKIMHWHAEGQQHRDPNEPFCASEYQLLKDGHSYGTIILTCDGLEAFKPEADPRTANHHLHNREFTRGSSKEYTRERNPRDFYEEDVNIEAEEFIKMEHKRFNVKLDKRTWSSG